MEVATVELTQCITAAYAPNTDILEALRRGTMVLHNQETGVQILPKTGLAWISMADLRSAGVDLSVLSNPVSVLREFPGCPLYERLALFRESLKNLSGLNLPKTSRSLIHGDILWAILNCNFLSRYSNISIGAAQLLFLQAAFEAGVQIYDSEGCLFKFFDTNSLESTSEPTVTVFSDHHYIDKAAAKLVLLDYLDAQLDAIRNKILRQMKISDLIFFASTVCTTDAQSCRLSRIFTSPVLTVNHLKACMPTDAHTLRQIKKHADKGISIRLAEIDDLRDIIHKAETPGKKQRTR